MKFKHYVITGLSFLRQPKKRKLIKAAYRLKDKKGIEIGGPSVFFDLKGGFPVYLFADKIDGVNFSNETVWEGHIHQGETYEYFDNKLGYQYIAEATELREIPDNKYDFLLSCHSLEHVANPIKALKEWNRILKKEAELILVLPDKRNTFDINRPYSTMQHLIEDYDKNTGEHDNTHFEEIIKYHEHTKDPGLKSKDQVQEALKDNFTNRLAHHHVFSQGLVREILEYCGFSVISQHEAEPFHLITIAVKQ